MSGAGTSHYWTFIRFILALVMIAALAPFAWYIWNHGQENRIDASPAAGGRFLTDPTAAPLPADAQGYNLADLAVDPASLFVAEGLRNDLAALDYPGTVPAEEAQFLRERDRLFVVQINDEVRAYPTRILNYHEVVNDTLGGVPIAVIYCPLSDSYSVVDRRVGGHTLEFGLTNRLLNSNTVFYDTADYALWSQVGLGAISGPRAGTQLVHINQWRIETFEAYREANPQGAVLSDYTGQLHEYGRNPYRGYLFDDQVMYPLTAFDDALPAKTPILAVAYPDGRRVAYVLETMGNELREGDLHVRQNFATRTLEVVSAPQGAAVVRALYFVWYAFYPDTEVIGG